jgi:hypothetical protein
MRKAKKAANKSESSDVALRSEQLPERVAELAGELSEAESEPLRKRLARQIAELAGRSSQATRRGLRSGAGAARKRAQAGGSATARGLRATGQWLSGQVLEMAPKIPIRSLATLQQQHPDLDTEQLANVLIAGAARASGGVGAAVGAAAAVPFIPTAAPVELVVETMALVAIELKLIAELHEVYGQRAAGSTPQRMIAYVGSWADRRGVNVTTSGLAFAVGSPLRRKLERRLLAKAGKSALALAPLLTGAAAGAMLDFRETRKLGHTIRADLSKRALEQR